MKKLFLALCLAVLLAIPTIALGASIQLTWTAPTNNADVDNTPLTDLAGYRLYQSNISGVYLDPPIADIGTSCGAAPSSNCIEIPYIITGLTEGVYYFVVTAYDNATVSNESLWSNEISPDVQLTPAPPILGTEIVVTVNEGGIVNIVSNGIVNVASSLESDANN